MPVLLEWARVQGEITHVTELERFASKDWRPEPHCLECGKELVARLGSTRAWHFAHKNRLVPCRAADADSPAVLRVHARYQLARSLAASDSNVLGVRVSRQCGRIHAGLSLFDGSTTCSERSGVHIARGWTHASTDVALRGLPRIDVMLWRRATPIFAWLVRNDRTLAPEEVEALDEADLPWLESLATQDGSLSEWHPGTPIPHHRLGATLQWHCAAHGVPQLDLFAADG